LEVLALMVTGTDPPAAIVLVPAEALSQLWFDDMTKLVPPVPVLFNVTPVLVEPAPDPFDNETEFGDKLKLSVGAAWVTGTEMFVTNPYEARLDVRAGPVSALAVMDNVWEPVSSPEEYCSQVAPVWRNHSQTDRLLVTDNCRLPPAEEKLRLGGENVNAQETGFRVTSRGKVTLPLLSVTVSTTTAELLFERKSAVILAAPTPVDCDKKVMPDDPVAVQPQFEGVVTKLKVT
jgi:hypothetical protein